MQRSNININPVWTGIGTDYSRCSIASESEYRKITVPYTMLNKSVSLPKMFFLERASILVLWQKNHLHSASHGDFNTFYWATSMLNWAWVWKPPCINTKKCPTFIMIFMLKLYLFNSGNETYWYTMHVENKTMVLGKPIRQISTNSSKLE